VVLLIRNGPAFYTVRVSPASCTCLAWQHYGHCYHAAAAQQVRTCLWCGRAGAAVAVHVNIWDNGAELALCPDCLTPEVK